MSLEAKIEELNENIVRLIDAMNNAPEVADEPEPAPKKTPRKKAAKKAPAKRRAKKVNYDNDVKPQVLIAIATPPGREAVKELLAEHGVKNAKLLDEDDIPEFLTAIEAIIEENEDDE